MSRQKAAALSSSQPMIRRASEVVALAESLPLNQRRVLLLMCQFLVANDHLPAMATISKHFGWSSANAAHQAVRALECKGFLERNEVQRLRFRRLGGVSVASLFCGGSGVFRE